MNELPPYHPPPDHRRTVDCPSTEWGYFWFCAVIATAVAVVLGIGATWWIGVGIEAVQLLCIWSLAKPRQCVYCEGGGVLQGDRCWRCNGWGKFNPDQKPPLQAKHK